MNGPVALAGAFPKSLSRVMMVNASGRPVPAGGGGRVASKRRMTRFPRADPATTAFTATLRTDRAAVTQEKLERIPFVPPSVWEEVKASGSTKVEFTYRHAPGATGDHYRVVLDPDGATVEVTSISLHAEQVRGRIIVEDGLVTLEGVHGEALAGTVHADGTLDFRDQENVLQFTVKGAKAGDKITVNWVDNRGDKRTDEAVVA